MPALPAVQPAVAMSWSVHYNVSGETGGPTPILPGHAFAGISIDLNSRLRLISLAQADAVGRAEIVPVQVPWYPIGALRLQALDLTTCLTSNLARVVD